MQPLRNRRASNVLRPRVTRSERLAMVVALNVNPLFVLGRDLAMDSVHCVLRAGAGDDRHHPFAVRLISVILNITDTYVK